MAQHDFVPAWLNFSTSQAAKISHDPLDVPSHSQSSAAVERHGEHLSRGEAPPSLSRRRHNSSDGFFNNTRFRASAGDGCHQPSLLRHDSVDSGVAKGQQEALGSTLPIWKPDSPLQEMPYHEGHSKRLAGERDRERIGVHRQRNGKTHARKGGAVKTEGVHKDKLKFVEEDFPSLNPESSVKPEVQSRAVGTPVGIWERPPSAKQTMTKMLVIKKVSKEDPGAAFCASFANTGPHLTNGTKTPVSGTSVYKNLVPKPAITPTKTGSWKQNGRENKASLNFSGWDSLTSPAASVNKPLTMPATPPSQVSILGPTHNSPTHNSPSHNSPTHTGPKEPPSSLGPSIDVTPPRLKLMRRSADRKSEFLRGLKNEKDGDGFASTSHSISVENEKNGKAFERNGIFVGDTHHLSSSLEAEHRLLKAMGWQEYPENDENFLPLTDDELKEFEAKTEKLKRSGLGQNSALLKPLVKGLPLLLSWRNPVEPKPEDTSETESTSSSQTSDDDAYT
ncbi:hypothetical protein UPYG_G00031830 [Umbra pygmaea]|uniref:Vasculin-like protein 1 n=1 Tax=Umbra pygmaea TaxID=75934 RepID=A0ABD0XMY0_UMBPY